MPTLSPSLLVLIGILMTALAQVLLKKAAGFEVRTSPWIAFFGLSAVAYAVSFIFYSQILKYFALNKIYPAMTIAQIVVITLVGFIMGEVVGLRHALGLVFGAVAIYLILA
jgi:multidrug transporter EmrE-like cation transporter